MNAVFIHIPKTGGLTVEEVLKLDRYRYPHRVSRFKGNGIVTFGHLPYARYVKEGRISKEFDKTAFKFAFCRNPYDRAVSHYYYGRTHIPRLPDSISFLEFTRVLGDYGRSFQPQACWTNNIKIDFLGRFERLEADIREIAGILGIKVNKIPHKNATKHSPYSEYYCEESKHNIEQFYQIDFKTFGYELNSNLLHRK